MGCLSGFFWLLWAKFSRRHHYGLWRNNSAAFNIFSYFVSFLHWWKTDLWRETEKLLDITSFVVAVKSLWPHKVGARGEIYSARWKLMLISDQAKDLKIVLKAGRAAAPCLLFNHWFTSGILNKSTVWVEKSFHVTIYVETARILRSDLTMFPRVKCGNIMSGFRKCCESRCESRLLCGLSKVLTDKTQLISGM